MKRNKKLISLLAVLSLMIGATLLLNRLNQENETEEDTTTTIFALDSETATEISWTYEEESLSFIKEDDAWEYKEDDTFPLNSSFLTTMLNTLAEVTSDKTLEAPEDLADYGLDNPECTITVTSDTTTEILLGDETSLGGERYCSIGDGNIYLVDAGILDDFSYGLYDIVAMENVPDVTDTTNFHLESDTQSFDLVYLENSGRAYNDAYVWFLESGDIYLTADTELTESLLSGFTELEWQSCVDYKADDSTLSNYGLDTPMATVTIDYTETTEVETDETDEDGNIITETQVEEKQFVLEIGDYVDSYCYARIQGSSMVYCIDSSISDKLLYMTYEDLQPDEVLMMDWDTITGLDIILDGETYHVERVSEETTDEEGNTSTSTTYKLNGEEITILNILNKINNLTSAGSALGMIPERTAEISFVIYRNDTNYPEVTLTLYKYDSTYCLAELNGQTTLFVNREEVVNIVELINEQILQ